MVIKKVESEKLKVKIRKGSALNYINQVRQDFRISTFNFQLLTFNRFFDEKKSSYFANPFFSFILAFTLMGRP